MRISRKAFGVYIISLKKGGIMLLKMLVAKHPRHTQSDEGDTYIPVMDATGKPKLFLVETHDAIALNLKKLTDAGGVLVTDKSVIQKLVKEWNRKLDREKQDHQDQMRKYMDSELYEGWNEDVDDTQQDIDRCENLKLVVCECAYEEAK